MAHLSKFELLFSEHNQEKLDQTAVSRVATCGDLAASALISGYFTRWRVEGTPEYVCLDLPDDAPPRLVITTFLAYAEDQRAIAESKQKVFLEQHLK
jgi:hypothetical protein